MFAPGARLRQEELAEIFNTSRIPVREALRALEYEGLVRSEPHRGFTVTRLDADEVEEVYDLRILLESHAVRLALPLLTDEDLDELEQLFTKVQEADTPDHGLAAREAFYTRLYSVTGRPRLVGLIIRLRQEVARALRWPTIQHSPSIHEQFFEAVRTGDAERAVVQLSGSLPAGRDAHPPPAPRERSARSGERPALDPGLHAQAPGRIGGRRPAPLTGQRIAGRHRSKYRCRRPITTPTNTPNAPMISTPSITREALSRFPFRLM